MNLLFILLGETINPVQAFNVVFSTALAGYIGGKLYVKDFMDTYLPLAKVEKYNTDRIKQTRYLCKKAAYMETLEKDDSGDWQLVSFEKIKSTLCS